MKNLINMRRMARGLRPFCSQKKPVEIDQTLITPEQMSKYPSLTVQRLSAFQSLLKEFVTAMPQHLDILKNSPTSYLTLFSRSCLIANKFLPIQQYYPNIKKLFNAPNTKLSPHTCTALAECFSFFKYEGDQGKVIEKLCQYYEQNCFLFTQEQQAAFWDFYMKIMATKAHSSVKFVRLERRNRATIEYAGMNEILNSSILMEKLNNKIIKNIRVVDNEIYLTLTKPGKSKSPQVLIRIQGIINFNNFFSDQNENQNNHELMSRIMQQAKKISNSLKKEWHVIFIGNVQPYWQSKQKYSYKDKDQEGRDLGYPRSQKIQEIGQIGEKQLNALEMLQKLRQTNRYVQGIFYNSTNPNKRRIDSIATLILSIVPHIQNLQNNPVKFLQQNNLNIGQLSSYMSLAQLKQIYGYSKLCHFHQSLYRSYLEIQSLIISLNNRDKEARYNIDLLKMDIQEAELDKQETRKFIASNAWMMADMVSGQADSIGNVRFDEDYDSSWRETHESQGHYCGDLFWQMRPLFGDVLRVMDMAERMLEAAQKGSKQNIKIKLVTSKNNIPYILQHLAEAKFWTVPKYAKRDQQQQNAKALLLSQLLKKS